MGNASGMADHRFDQRAFQALSAEECRRLLGQHHLGRIGLVDAGGPPILPVNDVLHRLLVVFRTDAEDLRRLLALPLYPWAGWEQGHYVRITPTAVSGRRTSLPEGLPATRWA
jgi:hypothetical protein